MALSPNFGFPEPDNASLVKNGAQDIRALGDSIDSFLAGSPTQGANKNAIINGGFDIAQRGTSFTVASIAYTVDRWQVWSTGAGGNCIVTRVAGTGDAQFAAEFGRQSGSTDLTVPRFAQTIETANSVQYAGKNIVVSFEGLEGANYSGGDLTVDVITGTGTDQNFTAFTGSATVSTNFALTGTNATYSTPAIAIPAGTKEIALVFRYTATGTAGAADYIRLQKVQLALGSVATPFSRAGGEIQGELAACQRYYYRNTPGTSFATVAYGVLINTTSNAYCAINVPVPMRVNPTSVEFSALAVFDSASASNAVTAAALTSVIQGNLIIGVEFTSSSLVVGRTAFIRNDNNAAAFLAFSAEL
jgi:hypothetical protein